MCSRTDGNKVHVCNVGDLAPGATYRTPDGGTCMVCRVNDCVEGTTVVATTGGQIVNVPSDTKLGRDRKDRLYASRFLNPTKSAVADEDGIDLSVDPAASRAKDDGGEWIDLGGEG